MTVSERHPHAGFAQTAPALVFFGLRATLCRTSMPARRRWTHGSATIVTHGCHVMDFLGEGGAGHASATGLDFDDTVEVRIGSKKHKIHTGIFINGQFVKSVSGKTFPTINASNGEVIAQVQEGDKADIDAAVRAARKAYETVWEKTEGAQRAKYLWKLADLMERDLEFLAGLEALDNGKTQANAAAGDLPLAIGCLRYYSGWCDKIEGKTFMDTHSYMNYTRHEPIGLVGQIIPWNFPILMFAWKIGPALACGNVTVIKPSEKTPLTALALAALIKEAGIPDGVVNVVPGYGPTAGSALAEHPDVHKIAFTGSGRTGRAIMQSSAKSNLKKISLELGGKSPAIVFDDANIESAVNWCKVGIFFNHGQTCCASSRVYVHEAIYDKFLVAYKKVAESIKLGDQFDPATEQGPQVDEVQFNSIMRYIDHGVQEGAKLVTGGKRHGTSGYFVEPTIFADVKEDAKIMQEEIFGPVVAVTTFKSEEEIIKRANASTYGLAAAVFTKDINRAIRVSNALHAGTVWVNCYNVFHQNTPFGGFKESGIGRELGEYALELYTQVKSVKINLGE
ncbi:putative aldehyde dehydrogenase AldA [Gonapodya prolifera JEL478]|uniref:Putative aldehyde dehydrogenase AldA n=1 Tax=Gonapodya prolifera (strain JEL478) TaxID=1344416 RepID=A0A139ABH5_GONPJ|nr:putative aldehyde dehydrogenase AldA [Gonapodya prolifera JEL478]|eukprot:KXS13763.1 putative aldehyde dehydrogenase AldA [Gonapodya prolifera JEL478]